MLRRYELTDDEWNRIVDLLPPENTGKQGLPPKLATVAAEQVPKSMPL